MVLRELPVIRQMTVEEFDSFVLLPENVEREFEYIGGEVHEVVSNPKSSNLGVRMSTFVGIYLMSHDIGHLTGADGGYMVSGERYIPDVGFIRYEKQLELQYKDGYISQPPDLAVEVLSPSNRDEKFRVKVANYLAAGTLLWVISPFERTIEVYEMGKSVKLLRVGDVLTGGDVLPGFKLAIKDIFLSKGNP